MAFTNVPLGRSAALGVAAALLGYVPAYALASLRRAAVLAVELPGEWNGPAPVRAVFEPGTATLAGWLWYNAHLVATSLPTADVAAGRVAMTNVNLLNTVGGPALVLYLVPPLGLVAAGYAFVRSGGIGLSMALSGGASVAVGYAPVLVLGAFLFTAPASERVVASPAGLPSVAAAVAYPVVFGALGGVLAKRRARAAAESTPETA